MQVHLSWSGPQLCHRHSQLEITLTGQSVAKRFHTAGSQSEAPRFEGAIIGPGPWHGFRSASWPDLVHESYEGLAAVSCTLQQACFHRAQLCKMPSFLKQSLPARAAAKSKVSFVSFGDFCVTKSIVEVGIDDPLASLISS
jgi:hypothetical protein